MRCLTFKLDRGFCQHVVINTQSGLMKAELRHAHRLQWIILDLRVQTFWQMCLLVSQFASGSVTSICHHIVAATWGSSICLDDRYFGLSIYTGGLVLGQWAVLLQAFESDEIWAGLILELLRWLLLNGLCLSRIMSSQWSPYYCAHFVLCIGRVLF